MKSLFVVVLRYLVDGQIIDAHRQDHIAFLDEYYEKGVFIASGRQAPVTGGIIIATCADRLSLEKILQGDPFAVHHLAEYQIFEFTPTRYCLEFKAVLDK